MDEDFKDLMLEGLENGNKSLCQEVNRLREHNEKLIELVQEYEDAVNAFLGAYEHGRKEHVKEAVDDLRRLVNETNS